MKPSPDLLRRAPATLATLAVVAAAVAYLGVAVIPDALSPLPPVACTPDPPPGHGYVAIFGRFQSKVRAQVLAREAASRGFTSLQVVQPACGTFVAQLPGSPDLTVARSFADEALHAGFRVEISGG